MTDKRTPLEKMIDEACGVPADFKPKRRIKLHCPKCGKWGSCDAEENDPEVLEIECPKCCE